MLKLRVAMRAGVLQTHAKQLDSAVNLREYPDRVHPDHDRHAPGVRVIVGPETRSLLRQLRDSRDLRTQQQLVREIIHQIQKRVLSALKRAARAEKARRAAEKARERAGRLADRVRRSRLWPWLRALPGRAKKLAGGRTVRVVGNRTSAPRTRTAAPARTRAKAPAPARPRAKASAPERTRTAAPARPRAPRK
jgi:hypothetical protein